MTTTRRKRLTRDRVIYPVTDDMGEHELQTLMRELLRPLLARLLASRGRLAHAGSDQFIYWERGNVKACVAPDLYVLPDVPQERVIRSWKTWEEKDIVPSLAVEIVTTDAAPLRIKRWRFQVFRRSPRGFVRVLASDVDRVRSHVLGAWLRVVGDGMDRRLRVATGLRGETLFPTSDERAEAERERADRLEAALREARARATSHRRRRR